MIANIEQAWGQKKLAGALFLDVKGAYDYVARKQLLKRMFELDIPSDIIRWTNSFLTERRVQLVIDGYTCQKRGIKTGIPQGSPISPILFIIYLSGVFEAIETKVPIQAISFVDDIGLLATGGFIKEIIQTLKLAGKEVIK